MRGRKGIALILVLTVVMALVLIATPFVLSMLYQEQTANAYGHLRMADYASEGARNFAVSEMVSGCDAIERLAGETPFFDSIPEMTPILNDSRLADLKTDDVRGRIWGLTVADEQGKANLRTAPQAVINRLRNMIDVDIIPLRNFVTIYSGREGLWGYPQRIRSRGTGGDRIVCDNKDHFDVRCRVRITKPGLEPIITEVTQHPTGGGFKTRENVPRTYDNGVVEVELRHPVNVNTASHQVLVAVMEGVTNHKREDDPSDPGKKITVAYEVSRASAERVARLLKRRTITSRLDLVERIGESGIRWQEIEALVINAFDPGNRSLRGTGTLPFTFLSHDVVTVEAEGLSNNPAGVEVAGLGFREVVRCSPHELLQIRWECQHDIVRWNCWGRIYSGKFSGYPFGNRVTTTPMPLTMEAGRTFRRNQSPGNEAWIQVSVASDRRGTARYINEREHYNTDPRSPDGLQVSGGTIQKRWDEVFHDLSGDRNPDPDVAAGGTEYWVRFDSIPDGTSFFDVREDEYENRISLAYEGGELVFRAADAATGSGGIRNGVAEIRHPFNPEPDTWYHIGIYWKGTRYAHLAMLVDGFSDPGARFDHVNAGGTSLLTELSNAITAGTPDPSDPSVMIPDTNVNLRDDSFLPNRPTPILVGQEVIIYDKAGGGHIRGARGTNDVAHAAGAKVQVFGYTSNVAASTLTFSDIDIVDPLVYDRITTGGASLQYNFGSNPRVRVKGDKDDPNNPMPQASDPKWIDDTQSDIGVSFDGGDIMDFPDRGYITIDQEVIYYDGRQAGGGSGDGTFTGCQRGQHGTTASWHRGEPGDDSNPGSGRPIRLWSVAVDTYGSSVSDDTYLTPTIIQAEDEWFLVRKDPIRPGFWISFVVSGIPVQLIRGVLGTGRDYHAAGEDVISTWAAEDADDAAGDQNCGPWDEVTLINNDNTKTEMMVRHARDPSGSFSGGGNVQLVAFDDHVPVVHRPDDLYVRVIKFPSGELIDTNWLKNSGSSPTYGPFSATIDEMKWFASPKGNFLMASSLTASGGNSFDMNNSGGVGNNGGVIKIGDEYIGFSARNGNTLGPIHRGFLNSPTEQHDPGDFAFNMSFLSVAALSQSVSARDSTIYLKGNLPWTGGDRYGHVLIDQEVIFFDGNLRNLWMPVAFDGVTGLFRGRYGTTPAPHDQDALAYAIPWRYFDSWAPEQFDDNMAYWQVSAHRPEARWGEIQWEQKVPRNDPNVVVHCQVLADGRGTHFDPPGPSRGSLLWQFDSPQGALGHISGEGQLDLRFMVGYQPGSFWPNHSWKRTAKVYQVLVSYLQDTKVLYHEDR